MFEKEAEEYVMREDVITENDRVPFDNGYGFQTVSFEDEVKKGFQEGAEFGYNKANEWHKERPKVSMPLILIRYRCHVDNEVYVALGAYNADYGGNKFQSDYWNVFDDEVIAWKEIVLPELKEIK